jgi:enoyl-CoA hydratase/carnithine racemase
MKPASSATVPLSVQTGGEFEVRIENRVATVMLNRPDRKNPLTFASYEALADLFRAAAKDDSGAVSAFVVRGAGGDFCSGGDVFEIIGPLTKMDTRDLLRFTKMTGELVKAMRAYPQPIVAAIEGVCAGAGAIIAMASDVRLAAPSAKTAFLFNRVGLAGCDMGACAMLPRIIGQGRASELLYTGRTMTADEGPGLGFPQPRGRGRRPLCAGDEAGRGDRGRPQLRPRHDQAHAAGRMGHVHRRRHRVRGRGPGPVHDHAGLHPRLRSLR